MKNLLFYSFILTLFFACNNDDETEVGDSTSITITSVTPLEAIVGQPTTFTLKGTNLSFGFSVEVEDLEGLSLVQNDNDSLVTFIGTPRGSAGEKAGTITDRNGNTLFTFEVNYSVPAFYLAENGITVKANDWVEFGHSEELNGTTYTLVNRDTLKAMAYRDEDVTKVVTSKITDMSYIIHENEDFNQDISNWDVSNVTNMREMLSVTSFNQDISSWDVSNVINIGGMFALTPFNQDISNWDVSNVTVMYDVFSNNFVFNQDLSNWSVDKVTECEGFDNLANSWTLPKPNFTNCTP